MAAKLSILRAPGTGTECRNGNGDRNNISRTRTLRYIHAHDTRNPQGKIIHTREEVVGSVIVFEIVMARPQLIVICDWSNIRNRDPPPPVIIPLSQRNDRIPSV
jgi:hypothetical protein